VPVSALPNAENAGLVTPKRGRKRKHFDEASIQFSADLAKRRSTRVSPEYLLSVHRCLHGPTLVMIPHVGGGA